MRSIALGLWFLLLLPELALAQTEASVVEPESALHGTRLLAQETRSWRLSAKTGACQPAGDQTSNWYAGYVEKGRTVFYFALQIGAPEYGRAYSSRVPITRAILTELGILD